MTAKSTPTAKSGPAKPRARRTRRKAASPSGVEQLTASARGLAGQVQDAATRLVDRVPDIEKLDMSQRRGLASISVAAGAALWLLGAPRILALLALIPAVFVGGKQAAKGLGRHTAAKA